MSRDTRIVAIGGGTGLSNLLSGLKHKTKNITAIVAITDDGGSSGRIRKDYKMAPPGDIRNCLLALSNLDVAKAKQLLDDGASSIALLLDDIPDDFKKKFGNKVSEGT